MVDWIRALLRKCVVFYSAIGFEIPPTEFQISSIDVISQSRIRTDLYPVLRSQERFNLQESQYQVKAWLADLLRLEDNEWKFIEAFRTEVLLRDNYKKRQKWRFL